MTTKILISPIRIMPIFLLLFASSAFASAETTVVGTGRNEVAADCSDAVTLAEEAADADAARQCDSAAIERESEYSVELHCFAHGYAGEAEVSATYKCPGN